LRDRALIELMVYFFAALAPRSAEWSTTSTRKTAASVLRTKSEIPLQLKVDMGANMASAANDAFADQIAGAFFGGHRPAPGNTRSPDIQRHCRTRRDQPKAPGTAGYK
jgi:hypothetical protein